MKPHLIPIETVHQTTHTKVSADGICMKILNNLPEINQVQRGLLQTGFKNLYEKGLENQKRTTTCRVLQLANLLQHNY